MGDFEDNKETATTEAGEKAKRISYLQSVINEMNFNLKEFNEERQSYNFQIKLDALNSLFFEIVSDLIPGEEKKCGEFMKCTEKFLIKNPILKTRQDPRIGVKTYTRDIIPEVYQVLKKKLEDYELLIKKLLGKHGFSGPRVDKKMDY